MPEIAGPSVPIRKDAWRPAHMVRALMVGAAAAASTAAIVACLDTPAVSIVLAVVLVLLAPTASRLDRRVAVNLSLAFGMVPVALWVPPVLGARTASVTTLSVAVGGAVIASLVPRRTVLPATRARDAIIPLGAGLAGLVALPLSSPRNPQQALAVLSTGIDNSYHYAMFLEQRLTTARSPLIAANTDGSGFAFDDYPQWFHKLITVCAQIAFGDPGTAATELVRFAQLQWFVFMALAVLVTAAFVQAIPDRAPPRVLIPAFAVVFSLLLGVPGALNLVQGHLSFLVAACAPLVMFLLVFAQPRPSLGLFVVLGGLVLVSASWLLLLPMAGAALLPLLVAAWARQNAHIRWCIVAATALLAAAIGVLFVLGPLTHGAFAALLRDGTVPRVGIATMELVLAGSLAIVTTMNMRHRALSLTNHVVMLVSTILPLVALALYMWMSTGQLTYYFWKLGLGSLLVSAVVTTHAMVLLSTDHNRAPEPLRLRRLQSAAVVLVALFGLGSALKEFAAPSVVWSILAPTALEHRKSSGQAGDVTLPIALASSMTPADAVRTRLLATRPEDMNPAHASEWFHALSHSATRRAVSLDDGVYALALDRGNTGLAVQLARATLSQADGRVLVTDPDLYRAIISIVPEAEQSHVMLVS